MLVAQFNDSGESSDEEIEEGEPVDSDTEKDRVVFDSEDEGEELSFESDSGEEEDQDSEDADDDSEEDQHSEDSEDGSEEDQYSEDSEDDSEEESDDDEPKKDETPALVPSGKGNKATKKLQNVSLAAPKSKKNGNTNKTVQIKNTKNQSSKPKITESMTTVSKPENNGKVDEYEEDSSDEEDIRNTVGNIPMKWYDDYPHIGYNWEGKKIVKPQKGDQLDNFLKRMEDPDFWRTIKDTQTGQDVVLSEADIQLITRIQKQKIPDDKFDEYAVSFFFFC